MAWERELRVLEEAIRRLNAEYDAFFYGSGVKPPLESRKRVEQMIRQLNAAAPDSRAEQYRFTTLQGRYNALCDKWERLLAEKEAGRRPGLYARFVSGDPEAAAPHSAAPPPLNARAPGSVPNTAESAPPPERDLFERYVAAKKAHGEDVSGYRYDQFVAGLARERVKLKERLGDGEIVFDVTEKEGRVRLVAKRGASDGS